MPFPRVALPAPDPPVEPTKVQISRKIETLGDIIALIDEHPISADVVYNVNMERLHAASKPLRALNDMIGLNPLKRSVSDQIVYYVQNLHEGSSNDYMHTVIEGPPGTGKTEVAKLLGSVFAKLGILKNKTFKKATRSDMVAGYLGQTALKTRELVKDCIGGVLFIDEAYALGNQEQKDSYSKECLDTLCEALSDHKHELMVIIAGYADQLDSCFFNYNDGLRSRFAWRFETGSYTPVELYAIFTKKATESGWSIAPEVKDSWFAKNDGSFKYAGRDIETLFAKTKIAHSKRLFESSDTVRKMLTIADLDKGYKVYMDNYACKEEDDDSPIPSMYM
jgi:SpoVK/Ycf46/Vps4 family AAA+-type ATPase